MKIAINHIITAIKVVLDEFEKRKGPDIKIEGDFYWDIDSSEILNVYNTPEEMLIGQISDNIDEIESLILKKREPIPYDLERLAIILRVIAIENPIAF